MKLSVSVPDAMWEAALERQPGGSPSRLVQDALDAWLKNRTNPGYSLARPADATDSFDRAKNRLAVHARDEFEQGYRAAVEVIDDADWWAVESLAQARFDVEGWARNIADAVVAADRGQLPEEAAATDLQLLGPLVKALGSLVPIFGDDARRPSTPFIRGFGQAMRDLWEGVVDGTSPTGAADPDLGEAPVES